MTEHKPNKYPIVLILLNCYISLKVHDQSYFPITFSFPCFLEPILLFFFGLSDSAVAYISSFISIYLYNHLSIHSPINPTTHPSTHVLAIFSSLATPSLVIMTMLLFSEIHPLHKYPKIHLGGNYHCLSSLEKVIFWACLFCGFQPSELWAEDSATSYLLVQPEDNPLTQIQPIKCL